jgi:hypothetical protein
LLYEYPEFTEEEFFNLEPTTLLEIEDTVYFAVELLEPQIYYWDCNKNKYVHVIYKFAMLEDFWQDILLQELEEFEQVKLEAEDNNMDFI